MSSAYYKRFPRSFLDACIGLEWTLERKGAYAVLIDLIFMRDGNLPDDPQYIAGQLGCSVRKWNSIKSFLISQTAICLTDHMISLTGKERPKFSRSAIPSAMRMEIIRRDNSECVYCGDDVGPFEIDHVFPHSLGGGNEQENLVCACVPCNRSKGAKTLEEWGGLQ
jgi:hypothetical protein